MTTKILGSPPSNNGSDGRRRATGVFDLQSRRSAVDLDTIAARQPQSEEDVAKTGTLGLYIVSQNIELVVNLSDVSYMGRSYPQNGYFEGIDFSAFDAYKLGVSRRHVVLKRHEGQLLIIDNNSTNGTYLNRALLPALQPYVVIHDDQVRLGAFDLVIKLDLFNVRKSRTLE